MNYKQFEHFAKINKLVPVYEIITADMLTPVLAYIKIREEGKQSFLLESVEGSMNLSRYSFIGKSPVRIISNQGMKLHITENGRTTTSEENIFSYIRREINERDPVKIPELPFFTGGIVGYIGYENISLIEPVIKFDNTESESPDSILGVYGTFLAFDHYKHQIILITNVMIKEGTDLESAYEKAKTILSSLRHQLMKPAIFKSDFMITSEVKESISDQEFFNQVIESKKNIVEGDIFQIVLSKRFTAGFEGDLLNVYRALRIINPSPYMYFLEFTDDFKIIGTSPENLVKVNDHIAEVMPIAGTRKRGRDAEDDKRLEDDLMNDPKEIAEHVMLLDLGRNDLGRVCKFNSIKVTQSMAIQRYSHVMHIVSKVEGRLADNKNCIDAFEACFPAGTVTGAPKLRAIQLIHHYEKLRRGVYAGAIGYIDFSGNLDMCIAIRTLFAKDGLIHYQAGAGIVADSQPELEAKEIRNKSAVMISALKYAEKIDEDISY